MLRQMMFTPAAVLCAHTSCRRYFIFRAFSLDIADDVATRHIKDTLLSASRRCRFAAISIR